MQEWFKECTETHNRCGPGLAAELPTRILDLYSMGSIDEVRLIDATSSKHEKYACLSHCWGGRIVENATTTRQSLELMKAGVSVESLPKTFRDAIRITRRLDIQYLWIDSLCILQDDSSDWDCESHKMASVYQNAFITIAATSSPNSSGGCFSSPGQTYAPKSFQCRTVDGQLFDLYARKSLPHFEYMQSKSESSLLKRGWAYQERLLSPRYLHFAESEVIWECNEHCTCHCSPYPMQSSLVGVWNPVIKQRYTQAVQSDRISELKYCWANVLGDYTNMALSFEEDRIRALDGVVDQLSAITLKGSPQKSALGRYIEGLWENTIHEDLCWNVHPVNESRFQARRTDWRKWRAPTWSWASVQDPSCKVQLGCYKYSTKETFAKILDIGYIEHAQACRTQVNYNYIRLELPVCDTVLLKRKPGSTQGPWKYPWQFADSSWTIEADGKALKACIFPDYDYGVEGVDQITDGRKVTGGLVWEGKDLYDQGPCWGLLLVQVDAENGVYKRIGSFGIWLKDWKYVCGRRFSEKGRAISLI